MGRIYWLATALVLGLAVHLATVLYLPGLRFHRNLSALTAGAPSNSFFLMKPEAQAALVPTATAQDIVGLCLLTFPKAAATTTITASVPRSLWEFSIYSDSGQQIYAINDVQAGDGHFTVEVARAKSFLQQLLGKPEAEDAGQIANVGWHAEINEPRGLAVLWVPVADALQRPALEKLVSETRCAQK